MAGFDDLLAEIEGNGWYQKRLIYFLLVLLRNPNHEFLSLRRSLHFKPTFDLFAYPLTNEISIYLVLMAAVKMIFLFL